VKAGGAAVGSLNLSQEQIDCAMQQTESAVYALVEGTLPTLRPSLLFVCADSKGATAKVETRAHRLCSF
jgi:hypothetical protein